MSQLTLLGRKSFAPFFFTQLFGALNDNFFKTALVFLITYGFSNFGNVNSSVLVPISNGLFILPFFLFSAMSGQLADKIEKSRLIKILKFIEIIVMALAALGFIYSNLYLLLGVLFLMGAQSTFFGPVKYSILPQIIDESELVGGNALIEMGTFLAILVGTIVGGIVVGIGSLGTYVVSGAIVGVAIFGWAMSYLIPTVPATDPNLRFSFNAVSQTVTILKQAAKDRTVFLSIVGISWFWFFGASFLTLFPNYGKKILMVDQNVVTIFLVVFCVGIALGSLLCEKMARYRIELGLVPFGTIGMSLFCIDLFFASLGTHFGTVEALGGLNAFLSSFTGIHILVDLFMIAMFGGFYIVPLYALVQAQSKESHRSRIIAANNVLNACFMVASAVMTAFFAYRDITPIQIYIVLAVMNIAVAIYIYSLVPEFMIRFVIWLLMHTLYRLKETDIDRVPDEGPLVVIANHVTYVDGLIVSAALRRPVRFVVYYKIANMPIIRYFVKQGKAIPIGGKSEDPKVFENAFKMIQELLEAGEVVCIFPEGMLTHDGKMNEFKKGIEHIIQTTPVPVVPMYLDGLWGSVFSRDRKKLFGFMPKRFNSKIELRVGHPVKAEDVSAEGLFREVKKLE